MKITGKVRMLITVLVIVYILLPLLVIIPASFTRASFPSFPPQGFSFQWYVMLLDRPEFIEAFLNSTKFALLASLISVMLGTLAALALAKYDMPGKTYLVSLLTAPLTVPQLVLGVALLIYFTPMLLAGTSTGFLIAHIIICVPYVVRFVITGLSGFDYTLERAAMILGAKPITVFWKVTLPLIRPAILSGALFSFLTSFDNVTVSLFMVSPGMRTLPLEVFSQMQDAYSPLIASVSGIVIFISAALILVLEKIHGVGRMIGKSHS
ncbi:MULTISPECIES: ABC transporter permease [Paenibacillus]|uniref:Spermidine/putrescine ABC transporter ATP-binding protein n=1 Tax=Paenibacillus naphthalenovorans TaxID=162209 RepID=A0A0U2VWR7_9BACL|nr:MULTISPECIES: ABC transporter permease [Paenibacillus]ALS23911.1 spermidine/putrescine ABC transporter ATP-binding protein [Paenibacillus naphthalenovorans]NTZ16263.1 ABC transporter permease [Paenibacillus sp. JMULE4]GCL72141.1 ABC transporter permease [Paenibacillus naphthalenovorans]SDI99471.1 putative spermidine/putrescine transport system permease protein [Paenibacillus naphthalenovorans]